MDEYTQILDRYDVTKAKKRKMAAEVIQRCWRAKQDVWRKVTIADLKKLMENDKVGMDTLNSELWNMDLEIQSMYFSKVYIPAVPLIVKIQRAWRRFKFSKGILRVINRVYMYSKMVRNITNLNRKLLLSIFWEKLYKMRKINYHMPKRL